MEKEEQGKELVETFCEITSSSKEEALFFLESHNFDLDSAVSTFFSEDNNNNNNPNPNTLSYHQSNNSPLPPPSLSSSSPLPPHPSISSMSSPLHPEKKPSSSSSAGRRPPPPPVGGIRTLSDLNRPSPDSDSDSDGPQEYYTGGQKSGMLVQDPTRGGNNVDAIFNQARQLGAVEGSTEKNLPPSSTSRSFTGTGRLLSGETLPLASNFQQPQQPERVTHDIVFYNNGFTVDDGPLRRLDDPENAPFLESIRKSECPKELEPADRRSSVHVNLIRREGNCPEREKQQVAFQGVGRTLGSSSSAVTSDAAVAGAAPLATSPAPPMSLVVDNNLASTSIQLRLADGTRMVARFNYHHRISDIRGFINASRPGGARSYQLQTVGFPPKQLTDDSQTIEEAGLANSVLIQKL